jgi:hypothetical protein
MSNSDPKLFLSTQTAGSCHHVVLFLSGKTALIQFFFNICIIYLVNELIFYFGLNRFKYCYYTLQVWTLEDAWHGPKFFTGSKLDKESFRHVNITSLRSVSMCFLLLEKLFP